MKINGGSFENFAYVLSRSPFLGGSSESTEPIFLMEQHHDYSFSFRLVLTLRINGNGEIVSSHISREKFLLKFVFLKVS